MEATAVTMGIRKKISVICYPHCYYVCENLSTFYSISLVYQFSDDDDDNDNSLEWVLIYQGFQCRLQFPKIASGMG
jgi:hypothetical protein